MQPEAKDGGEKYAKYARDENRHVQPKHATGAEKIEPVCHIRCNIDRCDWTLLPRSAPRPLGLDSAVARFGVDVGLFVAGILLFDFGLNFWANRR